MLFIPKFMHNVVHARWVPWKTQEFLYFHSIRAPKITTELKPFFFSFGVCLHRFLHHSANTRSWHPGTLAEKPHGTNTLNQNSCANEQPIRMCWAVSSAWSHRMHCSRWGRFLFTSLSTVQHLFRMANHRMTLHFAGLQVFQSLRHGSKFCS
jgi:hypothetical protein